MNDWDAEIDAATAPARAEAIKRRQAVEARRATRVLVFRVAVVVIGAAAIGWAWLTATVSGVVLTGAVVSVILAVVFLPDFVGRVAARAIEGTVGLTGLVLAAISVVALIGGVVIGVGYLLGVGINLAR